MDGERTERGLPRDYFVIGSRAGHVQHPRWYLNLQAHPVAEILVNGVRRTCVAETLDGAERVAIWNRFEVFNKGFARYQERVDRIIPIVRLRSLES